MEIITTIPKFQMTMARVTLSMGRLYTFNTLMLVRQGRDGGHVATFLISLSGLAREQLNVFPGLESKMSSVSLSELCLTRRCCLEDFK